MPRKQADVEHGLKNKGFLVADSHHHYFIYYSLEGKKTSVKTKTSHGQREISDDLIAKMARQLKVSRSVFLNLVDCPLSSPLTVNGQRCISTFCINFLHDAVWRLLWTGLVQRLTVNS